MLTRRQFIEDIRVPGSNAIGMGLPWWEPGGGENHPDGIVLDQSLWVGDVQLVKDGDSRGAGSACQAARGPLATARLGRRVAYRIHEDRLGAAFDCAADDALLRAGLRAGLPLAYECNAGGCGSCKFELVEGEIVDAWPAAPGLSERDRGRRRHLACQSLPASDCRIKMIGRGDASEAPLPERVGATLAAVEDLTHDMREFRFCTNRPATSCPGSMRCCRSPAWARGGPTRCRTSPTTPANGTSSSGACAMVPRRRCCSTCVRAPDHARRSLGRAYLRPAAARMSSALPAARACRR